MAYMISGNMDTGVTEYQVEAAISKVYGSVSLKNIGLSLSSLSLIAEVLQGHFTLSRW